MNDRFDAIGRLEDELAHGFEDITPHWEVRGADPVLTVRCGEVELELVPQDDGRFRLSAAVSAEQVTQVLSLLTRRPAPAFRTRSRRLSSVQG
ncbi:MAG: hypothetical protein KIT58_10030 [Planctomycetota bacterium]|nr:hypothetical protein [Planctomycetota bacterium]